MATVVHTSPVGDPPSGRVRGERAWPTVITAFVVSRLLLVPALLISYEIMAARDKPDESPDYGGLFRYDFNWYRDIAAGGFGPPPEDGVQSRWPFFPLYPWILRAGHELGVGYRATALIVGVVATLLALYGVHRLASTVATPAAARTAVWVTALFPFSFVLSMGYPSAIVGAAVTWALYHFAARRWWVVSLLCLVLTMIRPNGFVVAAALVCALSVESWRRRDRGAGPAPAWSSVVRSAAWPAALIALPSAGFVLIWMWLNDRWTGSPLTFWTSKYAWEEATFKSVVLLQTPMTLPHLVAGVVALALLLWVFRRPEAFSATLVRPIPVSWVIVGFFYVVPPIAFGIQGLGRYTLDMAPLLIVAAVWVLAKMPRWRVAGLTVSALSMAAIASAVFAGIYVP